MEVAPNHPGNCFAHTYMMNVCTYNQLTGHRTPHVPWNSMRLALLDSIMRRFKAIYQFALATIKKPPDRLKQVITNPSHCLGSYILKIMHLTTFMIMCHWIFNMDETSWQEMVEKKQEIHNHVSYSDWLHTRRWYH